MAAQENIALTRAIYRAFCNHEFDRVLALATNDVEVVFTPAGQTFRGHDGFLNFMQAFTTAMPDTAIELTNQVVTDDAVVSEFIARGTQTGPLASPAGLIPPTGQSAAWPVCEVWTIRDGKLARIVNYQDMATLLTQLGLMPAPQQSGI